MLIDHIWAEARARPAKPAFIHNGAACSYLGFAQRIARACEALSARGLPPGGVAVLCLGDLAQSWIAGIALRHLGFTTVAVQRPEDAAALALDRIACVLTAFPTLDVSGADLPTMPAGAPLPGGHILQTSGTTGQAKMVLRDPRVEARTIDLHAEIVGITAASTVYVRDFPQWTAGGYRWPLLSWHQGATVVFQQQGDFQEPLFSPATTHAYATPMTLGFVLANAPEVRRNDGLRLLVTGGAMSRAMAAAVQQRLTRQLYCMLASTEAATLAATLVDDLDELAWHRIHPSREVQVVDEAGAPLPAGQVGRLRVKILDGVSGYLNDEAASREFFREAGWFYPGDLAVRRVDGRLAMCGRVTDVINVLGNKIPTAPIEAALQERLLPATAVCLLSLPGPRGDEDLHVVIETAKPLSPAALKAACEPVLGRIGQAAYFHQVPALPRNRMGKVLRVALQRQLLAGS